MSGKAGLVGEVLRAAGVEDGDACLRWALGEDYVGTEVRRGYERWNERHGNLFELKASDDFLDSLRRIGRAYADARDAGTARGEALACSKCGLCCRQPARLLQDLGLPVAESGDRCAHLLGSGLCEIYDSRPDVCRLDRTFELLRARMGMNWETFARMSSESCRILRESEDRRLKGGEKGDATKEG